MDRRINFLFALLLVGCSNQNNPEPAATPDNPVVARVNQAQLTRREAEARLLSYEQHPVSMEDVINQWVNEELLYQAALQENLDQDQTLARMVEDYRRKLLGKTFLESKIHHIQPVTAQEIKDYYTANRSMFVRNTDEARIYHFILPTIQEAKNVFRLLSAPSSGEERRELFTKYHVDAVTVRKGFLLPELDDVIFHSRSRAKILGPIQSSSGYHVVEILDRYPKGSPKTLNQVYDEIYQRLITERQNLSALKLIDSLRINSHIEVLTENEPHE